MKSSSSGRTLAATNERQFLQVDSVSRAFWRLRLRRNTPYSRDFLDPPEAFMEFLQILRNDDTKEHRRTGVKQIFGYFRQNLQDCRGSMVGQENSRNNMGERPIGKPLAEGLLGNSRRSVTGLNRACSEAYLPANDSAAFAAKVFEFLGIDSITFISCQSYGNSLPQPKHATYVPVSCAAGESRWPGRLVIGKLKFLWLQPKRTSSRLAIIHHPQTSGLPWKRLTCRLR
jgi:hypothetical protein